MAKEISNDLVPRCICDMCSKIYTKSNAVDSDSFCSASCETMFELMLRQRYEWVMQWNVRHGLIVN